MEMTVGGEGAAEGAAKEAVLGVAEQVEEGLEVVALAAAATVLAWPAAEAVAGSAVEEAAWPA